jgi:hypothetical protein
MTRTEYSHPPQPAPSALPFISQRRTPAYLLKRNKKTKQNNPTAPNHPPGAKIACFYIKKVGISGWK